MNYKIFLTTLSLLSCGVFATYADDATSENERLTYANITENDDITGDFEGLALDITGTTNMAGGAIYNSSSVSTSSFF